MFLYLYLFHYYEMYLAIVHPFQSTELSDEEGMVCVILLIGCKLVVCMCLAHHL